MLETTILFHRSIVLLDVLLPALLPQGNLLCSVLLNLPVNLDPVHHLAEAHSYAVGINTFFPTVLCQHAALDRSVSGPSILEAEYREKYLFQSVKVHCTPSLTGLPGPSGVEGKIFGIQSSMIWGQL